MTVPWLDPALFFGAPASGFGLTFSRELAMFRGKDAGGAGSHRLGERTARGERETTSIDGSCDQGWSMGPLTVADLLPLEEYTSRRREFFDSHRSYLDRYRRVRIGPRLTLIFENRKTLWYRVKEVVRIARLADQHALEQ